jgi:hypothetical protein
MYRSRVVLLWLLLETGRRYRAEELLGERRLLTTESRDVIRVQLEALRELATMGDKPTPDQIAPWSARYPTSDLVLVRAVAGIDGFAVFSADDRNAFLDSWGAAPAR